MVCFFIFFFINNFRTMFGQQCGLSETSKSTKPAGKRKRYGFTSYLQWITASHPVLFLLWFLCPHKQASLLVCSKHQENRSPRYSQNMGEVRLIRNSNETWWNWKTKISKSKRKSQITWSACSFLEIRDVAGLRWQIWIVLSMGWGWTGVRSRSSLSEEVKGLWQMWMRAWGRRWRCSHRVGRELEDGGVLVVLEDGGWWSWGRGRGGVGDVARTAQRRPSNNWLKRKWSGRGCFARVCDKIARGMKTNMTPSTGRLISWRCFPGGAGYRHYNCKFREGAWSPLTKTHFRERIKVLSWKLEIFVRVHNLPSWNMLTVTVIPFCGSDMMIQWFMKRTRHTR